MQINNSAAFVNLVLGGEVEAVLIDTGAETSIIDKELADYLVRKQVAVMSTPNNNPIVVVADGSRVQVKEQVVIKNFNLFGNIRCAGEISCLVIEKLAMRMLVGMDYLKRNRIDIRNSTNSIEKVVGNSIYTTPLQPNSNELLRCTAVKTINHEANREEIFKQIRELDLSHLIGPREKLLRELLHRNWQAFAANPNAPAGTTEVEMEIDTGDTNPIGSKNRPIFGEKYGVLQETVQNWLKNGKIRPSRSAWNSQPLLVPKPPNSWRVCIDYRRLNSVTKPEDFPPTHVIMAMQNLARRDWYSTLDLASAYLQIPLGKSSQSKTAFSTPFGKFEFLYIPFGLRNAPAFFNQYYGEVLSRVPIFTPEHFFDDTAPATFGSFEDHLNYLQGLFTTVIEAGLTFKLAKCDFAKKEISFCGYRVGKTGISARHDKIKPIIDMEEPRDHTGVRSFMGSMVYYMNFIENYAAIAAPLYDLTRKGVRFIWEKHHAEAFQKLKRCLVSAPILAHANIDEANKYPFRLTTDASDYGIGGVLEQLQQNNSWKPVMYISRSLRKAEKRYSPTEREGLALYHCVKVAKEYLQVAPCELCTDHEPLISMLKSRKQNSRVDRWLIAIAEIPFQATYIKGETNGLADTLSRLQMEDKELNQLQMQDNKELDDILGIFAITRNKGRKVGPLEQNDAVIARTLAESEFADSGGISAEDIELAVDGEEAIQQEAFDIIPSLGVLIEAQRSDEIIGLIYKAADRKTRVDSKLIREIFHDDRSTAVEAACFILDNDDQAIFSLNKNSVLMRLDSESKTIFLPNQFHSPVINQCHVGIINGHVGVEKTFHRVAERCWWPKMRSDIEKFISSCAVCKAVNRRGSTGNVEKRTVSFAEEPGTSWHIDFIGPLPKSRRGGNKFVLVCIDEASGYVEAKAVVAQTGEATRQAIRELQHRYAGIQFIRCDNGSNFIDKKFKQFCEELRIELRYSPAYHPQSNGRVERANRTLKEIISKHLAGSKVAVDWFDLLTPTLHELNTTVSSALGSKISPHEMMYGRKPYLTMDNKWYLNNNTEAKDVDEWLIRTKYCIKIAKELLKTERDKGEAKRKAINDSLVGVQHSYKVGDKVLVHYGQEKTLADRMVTQGHENPFDSNQSKWREAIIKAKRGGESSIVYDVELTRFSRAGGNGRKSKTSFKVHADQIQPSKIQ